MTDPPFAKKSSKVGAILLVLLLAAFGGGFFFTNKTPNSLNEKLDLSWRLRSSIETPDWMGVGLSRLNFTEGAIIILVTHECCLSEPMSIPINAGEGLVALTEVAEEDVNGYCEDNGFRYRFDFVPFPVLGTREAVIDATNIFNELGVKLVVGYDSSGRCIDTLDIIRKNGMFYVSPGTRTSRVTDTCDSFYGLRPEVPEIDLIPKVIREKGVEALVVLQNDWSISEERHGDFWDKYYKGIAENFEKAGGFICDRIFYPEPCVISNVMEENPDFYECCVKADAAVKQAIEQYGRDKVGVLALGFGEIYVLLYQGKNLDYFESVPWFCTEGANEVRSFDEAGKYAENVGLYAPAEMAWSQNRFDQLEARVMSKVMQSDNTYVYDLPVCDGIRYDICWLLALSVIEADSSEPADIEKVFGQVAESYDGINGNYALNEAGDKINLKAAICMVVETPKAVYHSYDMELCGLYCTATDELTLYDNFYESP